MGRRPQRRLTALLASLIALLGACGDDDGEPAPTTPVEPCRDRPEGVSEATLTAGGAEHAVRVFVPSGRVGVELPAVLNWHGNGSDGPYQAVLTGYEELAEAEDFIVVHPTGLPVPGEDANSWELTDRQDPGRDDIAFAHALIDTVIEDWCADAGRIYTTGMSNGGFFTARLVCLLADRIAAASSIAGTHHPDGCAPARPVPYLAFHGTDDRFVPFDGGDGSVLEPTGDPELDAFVQRAVPDEFAEFAADAGCSPEPTETAVGDDVIEHAYSGCDTGTPHTFVEIAEGGHTWPSSPLADELPDVLGRTTQTVDATSDSWALFEQHSLDD